MSDEQITIPKADHDALLAHSALLSCCVGGFLQDGSGPHLAEPEVWARLEELGEAIAPMSAAPRGGAVKAEPDSPDQTAGGVTDER